MGQKRKKIPYFLLVFLVLANLLTWLVVYDLTKPQLLEVIFFDIGQGDSIFIETPQRHQILIDGGPDSTVLERLAKEMPFWDRTIDLMILTHPEKDHLGGLIEVLKSYKVENILWTGVAAEGFTYKEWLKRLELEGAEIRIAEAEQKIWAGKVLIDILHPLENLENQKPKNLNNTSIVARLSFENTSFLLPGDLYQNGEKIIMEQKYQLDSDVLKVAHHGSKTSSSEEFLEIVSPAVAVISVGKNQYGHPHEEVLEGLEGQGISVLRTDREGDIKVISDGFNLNFKTQMTNAKLNPKPK